MGVVSDIYKKYDYMDLDVLKTLLTKRMGYFPKFVKWYLEDHRNLDELKSLFYLLQESNINKSINSFDTSEQLFDYIRDFNTDKKVKQIIKSIPSKTRRYVNDKIKDALRSNVDLDDILKNYFSKKGGTCKSSEDIYQRILEICNQSKGAYSYKKMLRIIKMKLFLSRFNIRLDYHSLYLIPLLPFIFLYKLFIQQSIKKGGKIVYKDGKTIIVQIYNFSASSMLGSNKWCISYNKNYWDNYVGLSTKNVQYFIYQTEHSISDKRNLIGVTIKPLSNAIYAAHYRDDTSCDNKVLDVYSDYLIGKDIPIKSIEDLIIYRLYDISLYYKYDWRNHFRSYYMGLLCYNIELKIVLKAPTHHLLYIDTLLKINGNLHKEELFYALCLQKESYLIHGKIHINFSINQLYEAVMNNEHYSIHADQIIESYIYGMIYKVNSKLDPYGYNISQYDLKYIINILDNINVPCTFSNSWKTLQYQEKINRLNNIIFIQKNIKKQYISNFNYCDVYGKYNKEYKNNNYYGN